MVDATVISLPLTKEHGFLHKQPQGSSWIRERDCGNHSFKPFSVPHTLAIKSHSSPSKRPCHSSLPYFVLAFLVHSRPRAFVLALPDRKSVV